MQPSTSPTVVFPAAGQVTLEERPVPTPAAGEVLLRTRVSLVSPGTELTVLDGGPEIGEAWQLLRHFPYVAGYSNVAEVIAVGPGVEAAEWMGRRVDSHRPHAAYAVCPVAELRPVPDGVSDEAAALTTLAEVVMNGLRRSGLTWGESVAVVGLGLLGQLAARIARIAGARPIFGIDLAPDRLARLPPEPPFVPLAGEAGQLVEAVRGRHRPEGVDLVVEASGNPRALPGETLLLRPQGRLLVVSSPSGPSSFDFHDLCNRRSLTLVGAHYFSHPPQATFDAPWSAARHGELFLEWLAAGELRVDDLVTHRFPGRQAVEAYALLRQRRQETLGLLLDWRTPETG
ncbi:MAG TPA: zinc-binding alcohol dehydrogenase [Thermoanaerobaculia bacterium]|nr:zinc-binding alcohol dehydrogenase [Thermoanaerobaculia bacterium]